MTVDKARRRMREGEKDKVGDEDRQDTGELLCLTLCCIVAYRPIQLCHFPLI